MARYAPRSQSRDLMEEKRAIARKLLAQGLRPMQITTQLRCSPRLVRGIQREMQTEDLVR